MNGPASVSVIIPCYNCSDTLKRCVDSIWKQSKKVSEVILVDDASDDGGKTSSVINSIKSAYPAGWITAIYLDTNSGPGKARNTGWGAAGCEYITFLDSDDVWHEDKISMQYEIMTRNKDLDMTCHLSGIYTTQLPIQADQEIEIYHIRKNTLLFSNMICTSSVMLKKQLTVRFDETRRYSEDYMLWLEILFNGSKCDLIKCPLTYTFKEWYGTSGLSSRLFKMEKAELSNYCTLLKQRKIGFAIYISASLFSLAKFFKRLLQSLIYKVN